MSFNTTGKFIYDNRIKMQITQVELARKLGVTQQTISKWERGRGVPDTMMVYPLCEELHMDAKEFLECVEQDRII